MENPTVVPTSSHRLSDAAYKDLLTHVAFARRTYDNSDRAYGPWKPISFKSDVTGQTSANGLNDFRTGFQAHAWVNDDDKEIILAFAGTNKVQDVLSWPSALTGHADGQIKNAILAGQAVNALVEGPDAKYAGYHVSVTGHSLGGEYAQVVAATYGWDGIGFDGPGGGAIIDGNGYKAFVKRHGITPVGHAGHFVAVNSEPDGIYGGSLVGLAGYDVPGVDSHYYTNSQGISAISKLHRYVTERAHGSGMAAYVAGKLLGGIVLHNLDFIRHDIVNGNVVEHAPVEARIYGDLGRVSAPHNHLVPAQAAVPDNIQVVSDEQKTRHKPLHQVASSLHELNANLFSNAWTLSSWMMQLHLDASNGQSEAHSVSQPHDMASLVGMLAMPNQHLSHKLTQHSNDGDAAI